MLSTRTSLRTSLTLAITLVLLVGAVGCKSGFSFRNPFSKEPKASHADMPDELDNIEDLDELTPPPENYTTSNDDEKTSKDSSSLAQQGKYDSGETAASSSTETYASNDAAPKSEETGVDSSIAANTADSSNVSDISSSVADATAIPFAPIASVNYDEAPAAPPQTVASQAPSFPAESNDAGLSFAQVGSASPVDSFEFPSVQAVPETNLGTSAPAAYAQAPAAVPANDVPNASSDFPTVANTDFLGVSTDFPTASTDFPAVSSDFPPVSANGDPAKVALNYEPSASPSPNVGNDPFPTDSNPYSGVVYEPQTTSSGMLY